MLVVRSFNDVPAAARGAVMTIGNFDGVHRGHQAVIGTMRRLASALAAPCGAMLFEPHPRVYFEPQRPLFTLTPLPYRLELLAALKLDFTAVIPFDAALAAMTAGDFIDSVLVDGFAIRQLVVGYDFNFGKGRTGDGSLLEAEGLRRGFGVTVQRPEHDGATAYSSSRIREALKAGEVAEAARQLGRWWRIQGIVISGAGRGAGLGYPTANIALPPGTGLLHGIYATRVWVDGNAHRAVSYFGKRPSFDDGNAIFETFLMEYDGNLYGKHIGVDLIAFIRGDRNFADAKALSTQMEYDVAEAIRHLNIDALRP